MGLVKDSKIIEGAVQNSAIFKGMYKNGQLIYKSGPKIVTFQDGTDEEIAAMLEAHYKGEINIGDYWHVGDSRLIHVESFYADVDNYNGWQIDAQNIFITIIGINHDDLTTPINGKTKAAITVNFRECPSPQYNYNWTRSGSSYNYDMNNVFRDTLNTKLYNAIPSKLSSLIKTVHKKISKKDYSESDKIYSGSIDDKIWLLSAAEVCSECSIGGITFTTEIEGNQYEYFKNSNNRIKYLNNNGVKSEAKSWGLRSCYIEEDTEGNNYSSAISTTGKPIGISQYYYDDGQLSPAFCL